MRREKRGPPAKLHCIQPIIFICCNIMKRPHSNLHLILKTSINIFQLSGTTIMPSSSNSRIGKYFNQFYNSIFHLYYRFKNLTIDERVNACTTTSPYLSEMVLNMRSYLLNKGPSLFAEQSSSQRKESASNKYMNYHYLNQHYS